ncbi:hydantoinase/oxoprolinase family protein [Desulfoluna butyratoxydans]|uniref:Hydantoinase/oxoprolinase n=1 Tax=Desulfoluna butyratoxydans TaxID=231438 RepID=A0A4U8YH56_9BACT|nr:hydantoinase/oxoprolinase family protein [Desulfoluna butyratoxydans]VFQ42484.1 hydantoinase/oxoprolinase [Desulfoluna butyratoxydans]
MIIGLDVGGTHTDVVLIGKEGLIRQTKVPTDPENLFESILSGLESVIRDTDTASVERIVLSTTLTTNAVVTGKLETVGMVVAGGPGLDPKLFRCCEEYHTVFGAVDHRGRVVEGLDRDAVEALADSFLAKGIRTVGVVGKFSTRNPGHEQRMEEILMKKGIERVFTGHTVSGQLNFPRRIHTTFLNASVYAIHRRFYESVRDSLKEKGIDIPIYILKADGGTMEMETSMIHPGESVMSGPSASVMGSIPWASDSVDTLVLDVGGTTTDIAILVKRAPVLEPLGITVGPWRTLIRSLKSTSVGLGGDSLIRVDNGAVIIGPQRLGPAMAFGGPEPTPTDAMVVLDPDGTQGDLAMAKEGMRRVGEALGLSPEEAARKVMETMGRTILDHARKAVAEINAKPVYTIHEMMEGYRVAPEEILLLGGPAKALSGYLADCTDKAVRPVPRWGVANAIGAALARTTCEVTLFADTEKGVILIPEENYSKTMDHHYTLDDAEETARNFLVEKARQAGSRTASPETEIVESIAFNMVRGFRTTGKNIRVRAQVKPGLIDGYDIAGGE